MSLYGYRVINQASLRGIQWRSMGVLLHKMIEIE
jgi:hypothetical protein